MRATLSIRIYHHVKEYFQINGINPREILENYYTECKRNEIPELLQEKAQLDKRVLQIQDIVTQLNSENEKITQKSVDSVKQKVMSKFNPDFFLGKVIDGVTVTKKQLEEWKEENKP